MAWFLPLILAIIFNVIAYLLAPKPKKDQSPATEESDDPVAEAGKPIPVIFGTVIKTELNVLWFGGKYYTVYKVSA